MTLSVKFERQDQFPQGVVVIAYANDVTDDRAGVLAAMAATFDQCVFSDTMSAYRTSLVLKVFLQFQPTPMAKRLGTVVYRLSAHSTAGGTEYLHHGVCRSYGQGKKPLPNTEAFVNIFSVEWVKNHIISYCSGLRRNCKASTFLLTNQFEWVNDRKMIFTIHRYVFRDLLKVFLAATVVLSVVLGLGVMLRPLRQFSVDPERVPELLLCTLPITMTMVLPIAALLAATLVYGRLAVDNEINACRSSGIGLLTLIYPAGALALLVGIATLLLSFHVIPDFIARSESIIKADAEAIIYSNIEKKGNLGRLFPGILIYADYADAKNHRLMGVVVVKHQRGKVDEIITAREVPIEIQKDQIVLTLRDYMMTDEKGNSVSWQETLFSVPIPRLLQDDVRFKKLDELKIIEEDMTRFSPIQQMLNEVRSQFLAERFFEWYDLQLQGQNFVDLKNGNSFKMAKNATIAGSTAKNKTVLLAGSDGGPIKLDYYSDRRAAGPLKTFHAQWAELSVEDQSSMFSGRLVLKNAELTYRNDPRKSRLLNYSLPAIVLPDKIVREAVNLSLKDNVLQNNIPLGRKAASDKLLNLCKKVGQACESLAAEIRADRHSRLAFGVSCVVLVLMGAALGIIFRTGHLLTAFGWSFIPAVLCMLTISTGKHIAEQNPGNITNGIVFLWSGIAVVAVANAVVYKFLLRR